MKRCLGCQHRILFGAVTRNNDVFCSAACAVARHPPQFCAECVAATTDERPTDLGTFLGFGWTIRYVPDAAPCRTCGAGVARTWHELLTFPIAPAEWYLAFLVTGASVMARKLRVQEFPVRTAPKQPWLKPPHENENPAPPT